MIISPEFSSPFYSAYEAQAEIIDAAITKAIEESAAMMGEYFKEIYSIIPNAEERKAA